MWAGMRGSITACCVCANSDYMLRLLKSWFCVALLLGGVRLTCAFSLLGPFNEAYQIGALGYGSPLYGGDVGAPKNIGEEYRWNLPVLYYAFDESFLNYFGSNGVVEVDKAMALFNSLNNVSSYSADLHEFPLQSMRMHDRAEALHLRDIRSTTLGVIWEELGLAEAGRFVWTLRNRVPAPSCPAYDYTVIKRNFDPVTYVPSSYVNGVLATYQIQEYCPARDAADALEFTVDPLARNFSAVASTVPRMGGYFTGFTRDDVGGLRYLLRASNINYETVTPDATLLSGSVSQGITNTATTQLLVTSNLTLFTQQALTNNAAALQALYPDLFITSTTFDYTNLVTTNVTGYYTNYPWQVAGSPPVFVQVYTPVITPTTIYNHTYGNVYLISSNKGGFVTTVTTTVTVQTNTAQVVTNTSRSAVFDPNLVLGSILILPTNLCALSIVRTQLVQVVPVASAPVTVTNAVGGATSVYSEYNSTVYTLVINPVTCPGGGPTTVGGPALRQGIEKISFVRRDYDSLLGTLYQPVTAYFTNYAIANNQVVTQGFSRVVSEPDIVFRAADIVSDPATGPIVFVYRRQNPRYTTNGTATALAGPGILLPPFDITFNKVGPIKLNVGPQFLDERSSADYFVWGSFDGTTNTPVIYPSGTSIANLENEVLLQISPATLPAGFVGQTNYTATFSAWGGVPAYQSPFTWSLSPDSAGLPPGLALSSNGAISTVGSLTQSGAFPVIIRLTDSVGRTADREYVITINP